MIIEATCSLLFFGAGRARARRRQDFSSHLRLIFLNLVFYLLFFLLSLFRLSWRRGSLVSRRSCSLIETPSVWLFILWLYSLISSVTTVLCFLVSNTAASFSGKINMYSSFTTETVCSVKAAAPFFTAGSAQSEFKLTESTRLSTAINPQHPRFIISLSVHVKPEQGDPSSLQHFVSSSEEMPEPRPHCRTIAPSLTRLCSTTVVSELNPDRYLDVSL